MIKLYKGDCLEVMKDIPDKSIDMVLCDLPYGTTACKWDNIIPFEPLWEQYERIIKDNGAIVLFGSEPFSSCLRMSNLKMYRYDWVWNKVSGSNFMLCKKQPLKIHENILVFYKKQPTYNPQFEIGTQWKRGGKENIYKNNIINCEFKRQVYNDKNNLKYPKSIQTISLQQSECCNGKRVHSTQKPIKLLEYLIKTYTDENELVLDNCMGSGSTGVACKRTNRNFIGIELDNNYFEIAKKRIEEE